MGDRILMTGNDALAEGAIRAGCDCYYGYPITPQNELTAYMSTHMPAKDRIFIQAESELAAINMVFGSAVAGKRAMTSSSSPGISLKQEGISYMAAARLPGVIVNVQRGGPGLGNIAPAQSDYFQATKGGGHGDYHCIVLAPDSVQEMHDLSLLAFELADQYRMPVIILSDGRLGQMMEPIDLYDGEPPPVPEKPWALTGCAGREPQMVRSLLLGEGVLEALNQTLQESYAVIRDKEVRFIEEQVEDCNLLVVAYGTCARIVEGALQETRGAGLLRPVTLWPFPSDRIAGLSERISDILVVEMSCGQMLEDVQLAVSGRARVHFAGRSGGGVPTVHDIVGHIRSIQAEGGSA